MKKKKNTCFSVKDFTFNLNRKYSKYKESLKKKMWILNKDVHSCFIFSVTNFNKCSRTDTSRSICDSLSCTFSLQLKPNRHLYFISVLRNRKYLRTFFFYNKLQTIVGYKKSFNFYSYDEGIRLDLSFLPSMLSLYLVRFFPHQVVIYCSLCQLEGKYQIQHL